MNDHVKGTDTITGDVVVDEATQAMMDRINNHLKVLGSSTIRGVLPPRPRMFAVLCRMMAHKACAPEYENMLSNIAMLLALTNLVESQVLAERMKAQEVNDVLSGVKPMEPFTLCEGGFIESNGLQVGIGRAASSGHQIVAVIQNANGTPVLSTLEVDDARQLAAAILKQADGIEQMNAAHQSGNTH